MKDGNLYRWSFSHPWTKCISLEEGNYILREIHKGICRAYEAQATLVKNALLQGYYRSIISQDTQRLAGSCEKCQKYSQLIHAPAHIQNPIGSPWHFTV